MSSIAWKRMSNSQWDALLSEQGEPFASITKNDNGTIEAHRQDGTSITLSERWKDAKATFEGLYILFNDWSVKNPKETKTKATNDKQDAPIKTKIKEIVGGVESFNWKSIKGHSAYMIQSQDGTTLATAVIVDKAVIVKQGDGTPIILGNNVKVAKVLFPQVYPHSATGSWMIEGFMPRSSGPKQRKKVKFLPNVGHRRDDSKFWKAHARYAFTVNKKGDYVGTDANYSVVLEYRSNKSTNIKHYGKQKPGPIDIFMKNRGRHKSDAPDKEQRIAVAYMNEDRKFFIMFDGRLFCFDKRRELMTAIELACWQTTAFSQSLNVITDAIAGWTNKEANKESSLWWTKREKIDDDLFGFRFSTETATPERPVDEVKI